MFNANSLDLALSASIAAASTLACQGGCGERFALRWRPDRSGAYVAALEANVALQGQFEEATKRTLKRHVVCCDLWLCMLLVSLEWT